MKLIELIGYLKTVIGWLIVARFILAIIFHS